MLNSIKSSLSSLCNTCLKNRHLLVEISLLVVLILFLYFPTLRWLVQIWSIDEQYSHGFLVPLVSLYLIWIKRDCLKHIPIEPSLLWGGLLTFGSILLLLIGRCGAFMQAEAVSLFFFIPGVVLFILGWKLLQALGMSLFYLQFMIPWTDPLFEKIQPFFQHVSSVIGSNLLALKYPIFVDDLNIHLPNISLVVARECSGINFLITILAVGLPLVYLTQKTWTRACIILSIACLLSILSNGLRVAIAGVMGEEYGREMIHGPAHIFEGWLVAWVGWAGLFIANSLILKIPYKNGEPQYHLSERSWRNQNVPSSHPPDIVPSLRFHFSALFVLLFGFAVYLNFFALPQAVALSAPLRQFPTEIKGWQGIENQWLGKNNFFPKLHDTLSRAYRDQSGKVVYLFIGYYQKQDNERRLVSYLSAPLHENAGIMSVSQEKTSFKAVSSSLSSDSSHFDTLFWYQFPGKQKMTDRLQVKLHVLKSGILQRQNNGAIVLLATPKGTDNGGDMKSMMILQSFAVDIAPVIDKILP